ncbi:MULTISPECIES: choice-of-anchor P family protein [unclassified Saccharothrix]|uniref:choice-of-anchor P family protein n=1 Tax=unclassified Saccharothrix TaxID=2593673 RepID=UPI00307D3771
MKRTAALVTAALLVATAGTAHAQVAKRQAAGGTPGSAFALSASGLLTVEPLAALDGSKGYRQTSVASVALPDAKAPVITAGVLNTEVDATSAKASVADLKAQLGLLKLSDLTSLTAEVISATCVDGAGAVTLAAAKAGPTALDLHPAPNTRVQVPGVVSVVLNKQTRAADGSLTVVAVSVEVAGLQKIDIASATCAQAQKPAPTTTSSATPTKPSTTTPAPSAPGKAPRPTPVEGHLPVTG